MINRQIGYAVVGLGDIVRTAILSAFARGTAHSRLVAVVARDRDDAQAVAAEHRATAYTYEEFRHCLQRDDVKAAWIALPNAMRSDYAVEAARAGVHVLCESPMAVTADECRRMIRTCHTNRVKLMVGYRLHFQPITQRALDLVRAGQIGRVKTFSSDLTALVTDADDPRLHRRLGGGTLYDLGIPALNLARAFFGTEPAQVMAMTARAHRRYGGDAEEGAVALIRFPDERLAHLHTSFGEEPAALCTLFGEEGHLRLHRAYDVGAETRLEVVRRGRREDMTFDRADECTAELAHFSECIRDDREPEPGGFDGLLDVRTVEAIYRSARDGRPVTLPRVTRGEPTVADPRARDSA